MRCCVAEVWDAVTDIDLRQNEGGIRIELGET